MTRVIVHIDRLVLRGIGYEDRLAVSAGLRAELARLLSVPDAGGRLFQPREVAWLPLNDTAVTPPVTPGAIGVASARAIGKGLLK